MSATPTPFLRWAGGKRWIAPYLSPAIKQALVGRYIEPFLGSGAMFFGVEPEQAVLGDLNSELIGVYDQVIRHPTLIERRLEQMLVTKSMYYSVRGARPSRRLDAAIRFIYLNRTCFGGLHRTNRQGDFNVPYGGGSRSPEILYRDHVLGICAAALKNANARLVAGDFEELVNSAEAGDVVFCDPTYRSAGRGRFDRYGPVVFSWNDQIRLARAALAAHSRGAAVILMNADEPEVVALYQPATIIKVEKKKCIGNPAKTVDRHREILLILDPRRREDLWINVAIRLQVASNSSLWTATRDAVAA